MGGSDVCVEEGVCVWSRRGVRMARVGVGGRAGVGWEGRVGGDSVCVSCVLERECE